jgi:hypothetical protein
MRDHPLGCWDRRGADPMRRLALTESPPVSPLLSQINDGNWLPQQEAEALRAELFFQRAVHAYVTMLPALNVIGMRDGSEGWTAARGFRRPTRTSSTR